MNYKVMWATMQMKEQLQKVWKECFYEYDESNTAREYTNFFFHNRFVPYNTVVAVYKDQVVGSIYLLPASLIVGNKEKKSMYGYAVGVLKKFRRNGICKEMHEFVYKFCRKNRYIYILCPANNKLINYYKGIGLKEVCYIKKVIMHYDGFTKSNDILLLDISDFEYTELRNKFFKRDGYLKWDRAAIKYAILENKLCYGFCKKILYKTCEYLIFGRVADNKLILLETTIPDTLLLVMTQKIAEHLSALEITIFLPPDSYLNGEVILCIMGYQVTLFKNGYMNLLLN